MNKISFLVISTTLKEALVILKDKKNKIYKKTLTGKKSGNYLSLAVKEVMEQAKLSIKSIEDFGVDIGPGSFTGIRVAICTLQGLLINNPDKEVYSFFSSDILYFSAMKNSDIKEKKVCVLKRARENAAYVTLYEKGEMIFGPEMVFDNSLNKIIGDSVLINEEAGYFKQRCSLKNEIDIINIDEEVVFEVVKKSKKVKIKDLKPLYLQKPIAVENYEKNKNKI